LGCNTSNLTEDAPITDDTMALRTLLEKTPDADFLREMIGFAAERLIALEVQGLTAGRSG
jgi:putative transposase